MAKEWLPWGFINEDRINGRKIGVRYDSYATSYGKDGQLGQLRMEDGRIVDFENHGEGMTVQVSNGPYTVGREWVTSNGVEYPSAFDLIAALPPKADPPEPTT